MHWSSGSDDFGHFGISFLELLILFEQWAGHRLLGEKITRPHVIANRPILLPSVPVSEGIEIQHGCQFLRSLVRALAKLPGDLGGFLPCRIGSHMSRLTHLGWNQCSHGLTSRPLVLSPSVPQGCMWGSVVSQGFSCRAFGWHTEAPTLYYSVYHAFSSMVFTYGWKWEW